MKTPSKEQNIRLHEAAVLFGHFINKNAKTCFFNLILNRKLQAPADLLVLVNWDGDEANPASSKCKRKPSYQHRLLYQVEFAPDYWLSYWFYFPAASTAALFWLLSLHWAEIKTRWTLPTGHSSPSLHLWVCLADVGVGEQSSCGMSEMSSESQLTFQPLKQEKKKQAGCWHVIWMCLCLALFWVGASTGTSPCWGKKKCVASWRHPIKGRRDRSHATFYTLSGVYATLALCSRVLRVRTY